MKQSEDDDRRIRELVTRFRRTIEGQPFTRKEAPGLADFPKGSCGDASILLGEFFLRQGEEGWQYITGKKGRQTHAWIEKDGLIVDITSDQFDDGRETVVVTHDRSWHQQFKIEPSTTNVARIDAYTDGPVKSMLVRIYETLEKQL